MAFGHIAEHISQHFRSNTTGDFGVVSDVDFLIDSTLKKYGIPSFSRSLDIERDPFSLQFSELPYDDRIGLIGERAAAFGMRDLETGIGSGFRTLRKATESEPGFGVYSIPRSTVLAERNLDVITGYMNAGLSSLQIEPQRLGGEMRLPASGLRSDFMRAQSQTALNIMTGDLDIRGKNILYFDTETSGVTRDSRVWQIGASLEGPAGTQDFSANIRGMMDGLWKHPDTGELVRFEDYFEALRGGPGSVQWTDDVTGTVKDFLRLANEADYISAHNAPFDLRQMATMLDDVYNTGDQELVELAGNFKAKLDDPSRIIDTRALGSLVLGEVEATDGKRFSIENLLVNTTAMDDIQERFGYDLRARLSSGAGLHDATEDTRVLKYMNELIFDALRGEDVLNPTDTIRDTEIARQIGRFSALVPNMPLDGGSTPMMEMIQSGRNFGGEVTVADTTVSRLFEQVGIYRRWMDNFTEGSRLPVDQLWTDTGFDAVQEAARAHNLPFAGLSAPERALSTLMGGNTPHWQTTSDGKGSGLRNLVGEITGSPIFRYGNDRTRFYSQNKNLALSTDVLANPAIARMLGLSPTGPTSPDELVTGKLSFFSYVQEGNAQIRKDVSLTVNPFASMSDKQYGGALGRIIGVLNDDPNVPREVIEQLKSNPQLLRQQGIQLGILGSGQYTDNIYDMAERLNMTVDSKSQHIANVVLDQVLDVNGTRSIATSPVIISEAGQYTAGDISGLTRGTIFGELQRGREMNQVVDAHASDTLLSNTLEAAARTGRAKIPLKAYEVLTNVAEYPFKGRAALGAIGATVAYYMFNKRNENALYNESVRFNGYEDPGFYDRYKREMGEPVPASYQTRHMESLATAGMVQDLHYEKTGHHTMGPNKNAHLFS